ncbi:MAG: mannose-1-phosphate guanylyltransferase [Myxococcales bacterium]|nr:sugar phosphate nucleotidyltransferase [Polyangiaceae bacterium]MDW8249264.1 mannose-1-phosphate guanylyltransferase [Myxococcales bacterium]
MEHTYAIILAGGAGTRFWPASRQLRPKQFLPLGPDPEEPLLRATVRRILPFCPPERILIATGAHLAVATRSLLPELPPENILAEPVARNTAPCIGWATRVIGRRDPEATVMVFPADHAVVDEDSFRDAVFEAISLAHRDTIATIGLQPTRPETGYGYIEVGDPMGHQSFWVRRFVEKPDLERARQFVEGGQHLWNGGMFFYRVRRLNEDLRAALPTLAEGLDRIEEAAREGNEEDALTDIFPILPSISIDHGVIERAPRLAVVRGDFGWSDVGSWQSAWELAPKDAAGNAEAPGALLIQARNNLVRDLRTDGKHRIVALVGVDDLVVVETDDALLILPRDRAQDVRLVVDELKRRGGHGV